MTSSRLIFNSQLKNPWGTLTTLILPVIRNHLKKIKSCLRNKKGWRVLYYTQTFCCQCCLSDPTDLSSCPLNHPTISKGPSCSHSVLRLAKNDHVFSDLIMLLASDPCVAPEIHAKFYCIQLAYIRKKSHIFKILCSVPSQMSPLHCAVTLVLHVSPNKS